MPKPELKEFPRSARAKIYSTAWQSYCLTLSGEYAMNRALEKAHELGVGSVGYDVAREAIDKVRRLVREYSRSLLGATQENVDAYMKQFSKHTYYLPTDGE